MSQFTGKERDSETGLDYFGARYYGSTMGRWLSPDWSAAPNPIPYADLGDPQSFNLYNYVRNNPLSRIDVDGHGEGWQKFRNWWNYGHAVTDAQLNDALKSEAQADLTFLTQNRVAINGTMAQQALRGKSNKDIVDSITITNAKN